MRRAPVATDGLEGLARLRALLGYRRKAIVQVLHLVLQRLFAGRDLVEIDFRALLPQCRQRKPVAFRGESLFKIGVFCIEFTAAPRYANDLPKLVAAFNPANS